MRAFMLRTIILNVLQRFTDGWTSALMGYFDSDSPNIPGKVIYLLTK